MILLHAKFKPVTFNMATKDGPVAAKGFASHGVVVHMIAKGFWQVTHQGSGYALASARGFDTKKLAQAYADFMIETGVDLTGTTKDLPGKDLQAMAKAMQAFKDYESYRMFQSVGRKLTEQQERMIRSMYRVGDGPAAKAVAA